MNLVVTVLEIVAPVFLLAGIGFAWVRLGNEYRVQFVTQLAMTLSVPCLIFTSLMKTEIDPQALTALSLAVLVLQVGTPVAVTSYLLAEKYGADAEAVAGLVVVSKLLSVIALPVALAFLI